MAATLTGTSSGNQGVFDRLGRIGHAINLLNEFCGKTGSIIATDLPTEVNDILTYYDGVTVAAIRDAVSDLPAALTTQITTNMTLLARLRTVAQETLIEQMDADNKLPQRTVAAAEEELRLQMVTASATVARRGFTVTGPTASGTGDGVMVQSTANGKGQLNENIYMETMEFFCITVAASGGTFTYAGESAESNKLSYNWPKGSGASGALSAKAASSSANKLTNGTFEAFTTNTPDNWTVAVGTPGTHILEEVSVVYRGSKALEFDGDASNLTQIYQALSGLAGRTPYAFNMFCKVDVAPAAGTLIVDLHDGTSVINDDEGTANSFSVDLPTLGTTFVSKTGVFRLPAAVPAIVRLRIRLSVALSAGSSVFIDDACLLQMTSLYSGGPYGAIFAGATDFALNKKFTLQFSSPTEGAWQQLFLRLFDQPTFVLPSTAGAETILDSLIG